MAHRLRLAQAAAAAALLLLSAGSTAQALTDPTRPPLELIGVAAARAVPGATAGAAARPRLESILLSSARKGAIINGRYVPLGGSYGKATLVEITAIGATLKTGKRREVLQLYPTLEKTFDASAVEDETEKTVKRP